MRTFIATALLTLAVTSACRAQEEDMPSPLYVEDSEAKPLLDAAAAAVANGKWAQAIDRYQQVLREHPDNLIRRDAKGEKKPAQWESVRRHIFQQISRFPKEGRDVYRSLNDAMAKSLFEEALRTSSLPDLERIANDYFFTSVGDDASIAAASLHAEGGRLADAIFYWERVATLYPDSDLPKAEVAARWGAACRRTGDETGWEASKKRLMELGEEKLKLGGQEVTARAAADLLARIQPSRMRAENGDEWPRLGGNNAATRLTRASSSNEVRLWSFPERTADEAAQALKTSRQLVGAQGSRVPLVQFYPAVSGGIVVLADGVAVHTVDLESGRPIEEYPDKSNPMELFMRPGRENARIMSLVAPVISEGVVYVNFLPRSHAGGATEAERSWLAAIRLEDMKELWTTKGEDRLAEKWFGSPPVVYGGRVYAAVTRRDGQQEPDTELIILNASTGALERTIFLCSGTRPNPWGNWGAMQPSEAPVIAEAGGVLYIQTNLGAVAAVHACTGEILWLTSYLQPEERAGRNPRRGMEPQTTRNGRGLNPMIILENRVCCLAGDTDYYYEFDARTGELVLSVDARASSDTNASNRSGSFTAGKPPRWLVAVRGSRVILADERVYGINLAAVDKAKPDPFKYLLTFTSGPGNTEILGRPFVSEDFVYAPFSRFLLKYHYLSAKLAEKDAAWDPSLQFADAGHILIVGNRLLSLTEAGLTCFIDRPTFDRQFAEVLASATPDPVELEKHAEILARSPRTYAGAVLDYEKLVATCPDTSRVARARKRLVFLHKAMGDARFAEGTEAGIREAILHYRKALAAGTPDDVPGEILRVLGDCYETAGFWPEAVQHYQEVLTKYGDGVVTLANGLTQPVRQFAEEKIAKIVEVQGAEVYQAVEEKAKELYEELKGSEGVEKLMEWWESFPNSSLTAPAGFEVARRLKERGDEAGAARVLLGFAERLPGATEAPQALVQAAESLVSMGKWDLAEAALARLERKYAGAKVTAGGRAMKSEEAVLAIRAARPSEAAGPDRAEPKLAREWSATTEDESTLAMVGARDQGLRAAPAVVPVTGSWSGLDPRRVLLVRRMSFLEARDVESDRVLWSLPDPRGVTGMMLGSADEPPTVISVDPGTAAQRAELLANDLIETCNGRAIPTVEDFRRVLGSSAGKKLSLTVRRQEGDKVVVKAISLTPDRRLYETGANEVPRRAIFLDNGLLLVVRDSSLEAVDPETGRQRWLHCPLHRGSPLVSEVVFDEQRVFLTWTPRESGQPPPPPGATAREISVEAIDAWNGAVLWSLHEPPGIAGLMAAPGTGLVLKPEKKAMIVRLKILSARSGTERGDLPMGQTADGTRSLATVMDGRLYFMRDRQSVSTLDLHTLAERSREIGFDKYPTSFDAAHGFVSVSFAEMNRIILLPAVGDGPRLTLIVSPGTPISRTGAQLASRNRLYVLSSRPVTPQPKLRLVKYDLRPEGVQEIWKTNEIGIEGSVGFDPSQGSDVVIWGSSSPASRSVKLFVCKDAGGRALWETEVKGDDRSGTFEAAGAQGGMIYAQFSGKLLVYR